MNKYWNCLGGKGVALFMFNSINGLDIYALIKSIGVCFFPLKKRAVFNTDLGDRDRIHPRFSDTGVHRDKRCTLIGFSHFAN